MIFPASDLNRMILSKYDYESCGEMLSQMVPAVAWVSHTLMIVIVYSIVPDDSWELCVIQFFVLKQIHFLQFTHSSNQLF